MGATPWSVRIMCRGSFALSSMAVVKIEQIISYSCPLIEGTVCPSRLIHGGCRLLHEGKRHAFASLFAGPNIRRCLSDVRLSRRRATNVDCGGDTRPA